jgi:hypothetical protein
MIFFYWEPYFDKVLFPGKILYGWISFCRKHCGWSGEKQSFFCSSFKTAPKGIGEKRETAKVKM